MISKQTAEHYVWAAGCEGWHMVKSDDLSVIYEEMEPHTSETLHYHREARQFFFVLSGTATMLLDGRREVLHAQQGIEIAPGVAHQLLNEGDSDLHFLVVSSPPSHGDRVHVIP